MYSFESKWLQDCPTDSKHVFYRCQDNDIFALFSYLNFSIEKEKDSCLHFLGVNIFRKNNKIATNVYRKKTFSGVYTNFKSFISETYKIGLIKSLLFRSTVPKKDLLARNSTAIFR